MNTNELRDALSAGAGNIDARADAALAVDQAEENLRRRLSEADGCLVRLREEANRRRYDKDDEALVKLLEDLTRRARAVEGALALIKKWSIAATRREHALCDGVRRCVFCADQESYPELEEAGISPWPSAEQHEQRQQLDED